MEPNIIIVYPNENGVALVYPMPCDLSLEQIIEKDIPKDIPIKVISAKAMPKKKRDSLVFKDFADFPYFPRTVAAESAFAR